jgi:hypothetical protein
LSIPASQSLLLRCSGAPAVIKDVYRDGASVRVTGAATHASVGKTVAIRALATGDIAGHAKVASDGSFNAILALPAPDLLIGDRARYRAEIAGATSSPSVKLARRLRFRSMVRTATITTIKGHIERPLARRVHSVALTRQTSCRTARVIDRATPDRNGDFQFKVKTPSGVSAVAYRLRARVRRRASTREFTSYSVVHDMTLP